VALEPGTKFGTGGDGFVRLNFACSADVLEQAVTRMARSL
jgi:cystathionine beta-lyase